MTPQDKNTFIDSLYVVQNRTHQINRDNGFWDTLERIANDGQQERVCVLLSRIGLMHSELSEAAEAVRKHNPETWGDDKAKDTLVRELAGCVVRIMDTAEWMDLPLAEAILAELEANSKRGHMHGGKAA